MHQLYFVAVPKAEANTEDEAMTQAMQDLDSNGFSGEGGYFTSHKSDWYCVGGRWASFLCERHEWAVTAREEIKKMLEANPYKGEVIKIRGTSYGDEKTKHQQGVLRERAEMIWGKHRPSDYPKVKHDRYADENGEHVMFPDVQDCAELVTQELIDSLKETTEKWEGEVTEVFVTDECEEITVKEMVENPETYVGKYWLVVIDYHC